MPEALNAEIMEFIDNGYSGTNFERPQVQKLIEMVRANQIDCIIVKDFSRFGRNSIETGYFIERVFPLFHTRFISIGDDLTVRNSRAIPAVWMWRSSTSSASITAAICPSKLRVPSMPRCSAASTRAKSVPTATAKALMAEWNQTRRLLPLCSSFSAFPQAA